MDEHDDIRSLLTQAANDVPAVSPEAPPVLRRARRRATLTMTAGALAIVGLLLVGTPAIRDLLSNERPAILPAITGLEDGAYIVDLRTGRATRLEGLPSDAVEFDAAPGGEQIAFVSARDASPQVYVIDIDGTDLRRVTDDPFGASAPAWSPEGARIAYSGFGGDLNRNIFVLELTSGSVQRVTDIRDEAERPTWSRDGRSILYSVVRGARSFEACCDELAVIRRVELHTGEDGRTLGGPSSVGDVDVASDGKMIISSQELDSPTAFDIRIVAPGAAVPGMTLFAGEENDFDPAVSPDGTTVAFTSMSGRGVPFVQVLDLQGRPVIEPIRWAHSATWLSNDRLVADVGCQRYARAHCP